MKISCVTLFPELISGYFQSGLMKKAKDLGVIELQNIDLRQYALGNYKSVDDKVYGGGDGQLIQFQPLEKAIEGISSENKPLIIYLSPQGRLLDETIINRLSHESHIVLISGRYAGIDQRFIQAKVDLEISIGDYVLNGGELPSLVLIEAVARKLDGVLGNKLSAQQDSFSSHLNGLLEAPQFTKPFEVNSQKVPSVLVSGDHQKIEEWRKYISILVTLKKRPSFFKNKQAIPDSICWEDVKKYYNLLNNEDKIILQIENLENELNQQLTAKTE